MALEPPWKENKLILFSKLVVGKKEITELNGIIEYKPLLLN